MHILIYGNPVAGYRFVGPFEHIEDARAYMGTEPYTANIWLGELNAPANDDGENDADYDDNGNLRAGVDHGTGNEPIF